MMAVLAQAMEAMQALLGLWGAIVLRLGAVVFLLPAFGETMIPMRVRLGVVLAFSALVAPMLAVETIALARLATPAFLVAEVVNGLILGIGLRLLIHALLIAGSIAAQATSLSQIAGGALADPQPALANLLMLAGIAVVVLSGLHVHLVGMILASYAVLPIGQMPLASDAMTWGIARVAQAFALGFQLAAPFVLASLLYNLALGVINRAMPQMMVAFVGAPAIAFGGLFLLAILAPVALDHWGGIFQRALAQPLSLEP